MGDSGTKANGAKGLLSILLFVVSHFAVHDRPPRKCIAQTWQCNQDPSPR